MNKFKKDLQVSDEIKEVIKRVEEVYKQQCREMPEEDKKSLEIFLKKLKERRKNNER